jgi:acetylornithine deacetylase
MQVQPSSMSEVSIQNLQQEAIELLKQLIATASFSKEEERTAQIIKDFLVLRKVEVHRLMNNIWVTNEDFTPGRPTILLNSHHDTVRPNKGYTLDPFSPIEKEGKLFGLGSNDAGGALVSLIVTFLNFYRNEDLKYNLVLAATAEEEISGHNGIEALLQSPQFLHSVRIDDGIYKNWCGIVGEPTEMQMAVAERGLLVLDCISKGKAGHAARNEGENAIYLAMKDIEWFRNFQFERVSDLLGPVKMTVTSIQTENKAHNVVPGECNFIVDTRINELYSFEEVLDTIKANVKSEMRPRSTRLRSSAIALDHPLIQAGTSLGRTYYGSPTTSDKALMPFPTLKMGPGDSARSHTADEFIYVDEIKEGIQLYIKLLEHLLNA